MEGRYYMNRWISIIFFLISTQSYATSKTICGDDNRVISNDPTVGRALDSRIGIGGCTVTMIGKSCALSAGHCLSFLKVVEFNTPLSVNGRIQHSKDEDVYDVDQRSIVSSMGVGSDYAVLKLLPNKVTGLFAGEEQGVYQVSYEKPKKGDVIRITGHGLDRLDPIANLAQQTHVGEVKSYSWFNSIMYHNIDTLGGNSGASIIREDTKEVVGIHTHGGCHESGGSNRSTSIAKNKDLQLAIRKCLASEETL